MSLGSPLAETDAAVAEHMKSFRRKVLVQNGRNWVLPRLHVKIVA
jgi:hypothetical protein